MSEAVLSPLRQRGVRSFWPRALIGFCAGLAAATGVAAYLGISQGELIATIHGFAWAPLVFAAAGGFILMALQALRWWVVMRPLLTLSYGQAYRALLVGFAFNILLPARGGDLLRVQYLGKRTGVSRAKLLGTEIVDFWSDKWGWVAAFPLACLLGAPPPWLFRALLFLAGLVVCGGAFLAVLGSGLWRGPRAPAFFTNFRDGFAVNHWKRLLAVETLIAPLPWLWETFVIAMAGHALGLHLTAMQAFAALTAFNVAMVVPSPGGAGSFEAGGTLALAAFGVPKETALAFIFLYHLTQIVPGFVGGVLVLAMEGEQILGRDGFFRLRRPELPLEPPAVPEPDPG